MKLHSPTIALIAGALALSGCSGTSQLAPEEVALFIPGSCTFPDTTESAPDWLCMPERRFPERFIYAKGFASSDIHDLNLRYTAAIENAKASLGRAVSSQLLSTFRQYGDVNVRDGAYREKVSLEVLSEIKADVNLPAVQKEMEVYDSSGTLYTLIRVDRAALEKKVEEKQQQLQQLFNIRLEQMEKSSSKIPPAAAAQGNKSSGSSEQRENRF